MMIGVYRAFTFKYMSALISVLHQDVVFLTYGMSEKSVLTYSGVIIVKNGVFFGVDGICRFLFLIFVHKVFKHVLNKKQGTRLYENTQHKIQSPVD